MRRTFNGLSLIGLVLLISTTGFAQGKGNGKGGGGGNNGGGGETPPVYYQAQKFTMPYGSDSIWLFDGNNLGQAVGGMYAPYDETTEAANFDTPKGPTDQLAFYYDAAIEPTMAFDLNTIVQGIPDHLLIRRAPCINKLGNIAVYLDNPDDSVQHFFPGMIDMSVTPPQLHLVDFDWVDDGLGNQALVQNTLVRDTLTDYEGDFGIPAGFNDVGDMVIRYRRSSESGWGYYLYNFGLTHPNRTTYAPVDLGLSVNGVNYSELINNPTPEREVQVIVNEVSGPVPSGYPLVVQLVNDGGLKVGGVTEITPQLSASGDALFEMDFVRAINNQGSILGSGLAYAYKRGKVTGQPTYTAFVWNGTYREVVGVKDLNDDGDVVDRDLFHADAGLLDILQLLDPDDPVTVGFSSSIVSTSLLLEAVSERTATGFPLIFGTARFDSNSPAESGVLFVPIAVPEDN